MIIFSADESKHWGLKIGRLTSLNEPKKIQAEILERAYDMISFTVSVNDRNHLRKLDEVGFHYAQHYVSTLSVLDFSENINQVELVSPISFEFHQYDSRLHKELLHEMTYQCMKDTRGWYYEHPYHNVLPIQNLFRLHASYATQFDHRLEKSKDAYISFGEDGKPISFFVLKLDDENKSVEAYMGGVMKEFRSLNVGHDSYVKLIRDILMKKGYEKLSANIQVQNIPSFKTAFLQSSGLIPTAGFLRYNIFPFLSDSGNTVFYGNENDLSNLIRLEEGKGFFIREKRKINHCLSNKLMIKHIVKNEKEIRIVIGYMNGDKIINAVYYTLIKNEL